MSLFTDKASIVSANITELLKSKVNNRMASQPLFIQTLFGNLCWESRVNYSKKIKFATISYINCTLIGYI